MAQPLNTITKEINGCTIRLSFSQHFIVLYCDGALLQLLSHQPNEHLECIIATLNTQYQQTFLQPLPISRQSLWLELVAHHHVYLLAQYWTKKQLPFSSFFKKIAQRSYQIDCGTRKLDRNRWFWDFFCILNPIIKRLI